MENSYTSRQPYGATQKAASILARSSSGYGTNASLFQSYNRNQTQNTCQGYTSQWRGAYQSVQTPTVRAPKTPHRRMLGNVEYIIRKGSITKYASETGAIVNAANEQGLGGGGVDGAISTAGGKGLSDARKALSVIWDNVRVRTGDARATESGNLKVPYVIHAVGPNLTDSEQNLDMLKASYTSAVDEAYRKDLDSLAFPIISGGVFRGHYPLKTIIKTAFDAIVGNEKELKSIIFYGFNDNEVSLLCRELDSHVNTVR